MGEDSAADAPANLQGFAYGVSLSPTPEAVAIGT